MLDIIEVYPADNPHRRRVRRRVQTPYLVGEFNLNGSTVCRWAGRVVVSGKVYTARAFSPVGFRPLHWVVL